MAPRRCSLWGLCPLSVACRLLVMWFPLVIRKLLVTCPSLAACLLWRTSRLSTATRNLTTTRFPQRVVARFRPTTNL